MNTTEILKRWASKGIKVLPPDDPFYSSGPSILFRSGSRPCSSFTPPPHAPPPRDDRPLPPRPEGFQCVLAQWGGKLPRGVRRTEPPVRTFLGMVGWNWSMGRERYDAYSLESSRDGKYWMLYIEYKDDWLGCLDRGYIAAYGPCVAATEFEAAVHLLVTIWSDPENTAGPFHEVHNEGFLSRGEFDAVKEAAKTLREERSRASV